MTYADLADRVEARAAELGPGRRVVAVQGGNHAETVVTHLAALAAGHVSWLLPPDSPAEPLERFSPDTVVRVHDGAVRIEWRRDAPDRRPHRDLAMLMGTSGSTGAPRLVRLSHRNLDANAAAIIATLGITRADRAVTSLPMHYCYGLSVVHSHIRAGAALVLTDASVCDETFWHLMRRHRVTTFAGVPHTFDLLDRAGFAEMDLPDLRYVTQAGGRMPPCQVHRFGTLGRRRGWDLVVMYGQTEATARMAVLPPHLTLSRPGAVGFAIPGGRLTVDPDPDGGPAGVGELVYRGPNVMLGYADGPEDLRLGRTVHALRTGDVGRLGPDGVVEVVGRRSRFLKLFGLRVDLQHLEAWLARSGVRAVCAGGDDRLVVAVEDPLDGAALARTVASHLGVPATRVTAVCGEPVPRLASGKPDLHALARLPEPADPSPGPTAVGADAVRGVFARVLDRHHVGLDDTFAGLGGDSLSYVEMSVALEEVLGELPPGWPELTVGELAGRVPRARRVPRVETNVAVRAAAITLVVAGHMTSVVPPGGAHLLLALAGFNFARFALAAVTAPGRFLRALGTVARIAVPTSAWIGLQMLMVGGYGVGALLLVNNWVGRPQHTNHRWEYWFIEALVQILLVLAVVFAIPGARALERRFPFAVPLVLLGVALLPRYQLVPIGNPHNMVFRPHTVLWVFVLGWLVCRASTTWRRLVVSVLACAVVPGFFGQPVREAIIVAGVLAVVWIPCVPLPRPVNHVVGQVAGASMFIYLTHWQVWWHLTPLMPLPLAVAATIGVGVGAWTLSQVLAGSVARRWSRRVGPTRSTPRGGTAGVWWPAVPPRQGRVSRG